MNNKIKIKVPSNNKLELNSFFINNKINFEYLKEYNDTYIFNIDYNDYKLIKRKYNKTKIIKYYGKTNYIKFIKKNFIFILSILWGLFLLYILSNTIFNVEIKSNNEDLIYILNNELNNYGIHKYGFIKSYDEIESIKKEILKKNNNLLEWLEIKRDGTKYEIMFTERVIINDIKDNSYRNIISKKDAIIKHINSSNGVILKDVNDYVKKGEVIISGNIYKGETYIKSVHAEGNIYGEVWYTVKTKIPYNYIEYSRTGKVINHYYISVFGNKMSLIGRYNTNYSINNTILLIDKPYLGFKLYKEVKELYTYKIYKVNKKEAYEEAIKRSDISIKNKLNKDEYIISKKVLNILDSSSKIEVEIFYKVYENITDIETIEEKKEYEE